MARLCLVLLSILGIAPPGVHAQPSSSPPLRIVAAENFYGGVAQQIAGSGATVTSILTNPNQDPHEFTSSASTARAVADADIVIYNGIGYDEWMEKLLGVNGKPGRVTVNVADLIGAKNGDNPHIWYSPRTMPALAQKLVDILKERDVDLAKTCPVNLHSFQEAMSDEASKIAQLKRFTNGVTVTATEPVFGYMAQELGFKMLNYDFQVKVMNDAEPSAAETAAFEKSLRSRQAKILFYNSQVTDPTTARLQAIARNARVPIVGVTETQPTDQSSYALWMNHELDSVQAALSAKSR